MEISSVKTENFEMEYMTFGEGEKIFVILPGLSLKSVLTSADAIYSAYKDFENKYTVYLFDRKKNIKAGYTIEEMADDTAKAMKTLGLFNACVFGASQGGMIAQIIAIKYPELIEKLVLGSTASRIANEQKGVISEWIRYAKSGDIQSLNKSSIENMFSDEFCAKFEEILLSTPIDATQYDCERFVILANAVEGFDIYNSLDKIKCDTLVIGAKQDKVLPCECSCEIAKKLNCELYIYDNYSHAVYDEAPDYKNRILEFFEK